MNPQSVTFQDFTVSDPQRYCNIVETSMSYWPLDWNMVAERLNRPMGTKPYKWLRDNCVKRFEVMTDNETGLRVFAFECDEECALFKLSF